MNPDTLKLENTMHDFTKDELLILHLDVNTALNKDHGILKPSSSHLALREKLEDMIENYSNNNPKEHNEI